MTANGGALLLRSDAPAFPHEERAVARKTQQAQMAAGVAADAPAGGAPPFRPKPCSTDGGSYPASCGVTTRERQQQQQRVQAPLPQEPVHLPADRQPQCGAGPWETRQDAFRQRTRPNNSDERLMLFAVHEAFEGVTHHRGKPFGALIARNKQIVASAHATEDDCLCHAEMNCIRTACKLLDTHCLADCELFSTCEPCPMCLGAIHRAGIRRIVMGTGADIAAAYGFEDLRYCSQEGGEPAEERGWSSAADTPAGPGATVADEARTRGVAGDTQVATGKPPPLSKSAPRVLTRATIHEMLTSALASWDRHQQEERQQPDFGVGGQNFFSFQTAPHTPTQGSTTTESHTGRGGVLGTTTTSVSSAGSSRSRDSSSDGRPAAPCADQTQQRREERAADAAPETEADERLALPFSAVVVTAGDGRRIATKANSVLRDRDPTASAQVNAIRHACRVLGRNTLEDCHLYLAPGVAEPFSLMDLGAIYWSGLGSVHLDTDVTSIACKERHSATATAKPTISLGQYEGWKKCYLQLHMPAPDEQQRPVPAIVRDVCFDACRAVIELWHQRRRLLFPVARHSHQDV